MLPWVVSAGDLDWDWRWDLRSEPSHQVPIASKQETSTSLDIASAARFARRHDSSALVDRASKFELDPVCSQSLASLYPLALRNQRWKDEDLPDAHGDWYRRLGSVQARQPGPGNPWYTLSSSDPESLAETILASRYLIHSASCEREGGLVRSLEIVLTADQRLGLRHRFALAKDGRTLTSLSIDRLCWPSCL